MELIVQSFSTQIIYHKEKAVCACTGADLGDYNLKNEPFPFIPIEFVSSQERHNTALYCNNYDGKKLLNMIFVKASHNANENINFSSAQKISGSKPIDTSPVETSFHGSNNLSIMHAIVSSRAVEERLQFCTPTLFFNDRST
jgi:hypothetical protein